MQLIGYGLRLCSDGRVWRIWFISGHGGSLNISVPASGHRAAEEELGVVKLVLGVGSADGVGIGEGVQVCKQTEPGGEVFGRPCCLCKMSWPRNNVAQMCIYRQNGWYQTSWMEPNLGFYENAIKTHLFRCFCSGGPLLPFTPALDSFWLAPDGSSVCWETGCGAIPAQSEMEIQIEIYHRGGLTCQCMSQQLITPFARCWCGWMLCNSRTNCNRLNIYRCEIISDIDIKFITHKPKAEMQHWGLVSYFYFHVCVHKHVAIPPGRECVFVDVLLGNRLTSFNNPTALFSSTSALWYLSCNFFCYVMSCCRCWCGSRHVEWWDDCPMLKVLSDVLSADGF